MRFTIDSNILVYAVDNSAPDRQRIARDIMVRAPMLDAVLTGQALGEFLNVIRRKAPDHFQAALGQARRWLSLFPVGATTAEHIPKAAAFADRYRLQFWDCVIWQVAREMHAVVLLSEDLQDGFSAGGMTVLNPFSLDNAQRLADLLEASGSVD